MCITLLGLPVYATHLELPVLHTAGHTVTQDYLCDNVSINLCVTELGLPLHITLLGPLVCHSDTGSPMCQSIRATYVSLR